MYIYILFQILFPYRLLQNMKYSSLCYTVSLYECILLTCLFSFGCTGSLLLHRGLCSSWGLQASPCDDLSCCRAHAPGPRASAVVGTGLLSHRVWNHSGPGIEPVSAALPGRFFPTAPPGKSASST